MTAATGTKCQACGQVVMGARALSFGEWRDVLFTARPAILYTLERSPNDDERQAVRYAPELKLYLYHDAVCPRRQLMPVAGEATCRSCPASVLWVKSPLGANLPLDYMPVTVYEIDQESLVVQATEHEAPAPLYLSHFASCVHAAAHSKGKKK